MSSDAYARQATREVLTWKPFIYSFPFTANETTDRVIFFGLYSGSYLNGKAYLVQIEDAELANLLANYNSQLADLTAQEQIVVSEISSKRYISGIEKLIHDEKMVTEQQKIDAEDAMWDAKIAALASDRAALSTMKAKIASEILKNEARITELTSFIEIEGINLSEVEIQIAEKEIEISKIDNRKVNVSNEILGIQLETLKSSAKLSRAEIDIAEKEIQSAKVDLQKLQTANEILKIQVETVNKANELIDIDLKIARLKVDTAETERNISKIDLLANDVSIERSQTQITEAEEPVEDSKLDLITAKGAEIDAEITYQETLLDQEQELFDNKNSLIDLRHLTKEQELEMRRARNQLSIDQQREYAALDKTFADNEKTATGGYMPGSGGAPGTTSGIDGPAIEAAYQRVTNANTRIAALLAAKEKLLLAGLVTSLTHEISKKPETT